MVWGDIVTWVHGSGHSRLCSSGSRARGDKALANEISQRIIVDIRSIYEASTKEVSQGVTINISDVVNARSLLRFWTSLQAVEELLSMAGHLAWAPCGHYVP
uniref:Uncharacterized protein n=1 Tax=Opuntia streptacantha TaxID=393608 RepID=A0A7C9D8U0_OPUST